MPWNSVQQQEEANCGHTAGNYDMREKATPKFVFCIPFVSHFEMTQFWK